MSCDRRDITEQKCDPFPGRKARMREVVEIQGLGNERRGSLPDNSLLGNNPESGQMQPAMQPNH